MIGVLCFIVPIILFLVSLPLKALIKVWELKLKSDSGNTLASKLGIVGGSIAKDSVRSSVKLGGTAIRNAPKNAVTATKLTLRASKLAINAVKTTIRLLRATVALLRTLALFLASLGTTAVVVIMLVLATLIVVVSSVVLFEDSILPKGVTADAESTLSGTGTGYDYSVINWDGDFTSSLESVEANYGKSGRDWTELVILSMRTDKSVKLPVQNWWTGFKIVETGSEVMKSNQAGQYPITDYSYVNDYDNGWNCFGPMQIQRPSKSTWCANNASYTPKNAPPNSDSRDSSTGSVFFYPDLCLGTSTRLNELVSKCMNNLDKYYYVDEAFVKQGVTPTDDKRRKIFLVLTSMAYNCGDIPTNSSKTFFLPEAKAVACYMVAFFEKYGYDYNSKQASLFSSMFSDASTGGVAISLNREAVSSKLVGKGAEFTLEQSGEYGVISPDGSPESGTLLSYLMSDASEEVRGIVSSGMLNHWSGNAVNRDICYYGFSNYACAFYTIDTAVDYLGLRSQLGSEVSTGGTIFDVALRAGKTGTAEDSSDRLTYYLGSDEPYEADCSRFVFRVLVDAEVNAFGLEPSQVTSIAPNFDVVSSSTHSLGLNKSTGVQVPWVRNNAPDAVVWDSSMGALDYALLQAGDLLYTPGHVMIYMGKNKSGVDYIVHAQGRDNPTCSNDPDNLVGGKYTFGFSALGKYRAINFVARPSKF